MMKNAEETLRDREDTVRRRNTCVAEFQSQRRNKMKPKQYVKMPHCDLDPSKRDESHQNLVKRPKQDF